MKGHYFVKLDSDTDAIRAALPVYEVRSLFMGNRFVSIPFSTLSDPLVSTPQELNALLEPVQELARSRRHARIEIRTTETADLFRDSQFQGSRTYKRHVLKLDASPEELKKRFHRSCVRQRIDRALKSELAVFEAQDDRHLGDFQRLHALTRKRLGLPPQPGRFFRNLFQHLAGSGKLTLFIATMRGHVVGGLILLHHGERASAEAMAEDVRFRALCPVHLLFWEAIKFASSAGYAVFDFGRTADSNKGLMTFKSRWATEAVDLPVFSCPEVCARPAGERRVGLCAYPWVTRLIKHAPMPMARLVGEFCYRHMG